VSAGNDGASLKYGHKIGGGCRGFHEPTFEVDNRRRFRNPLPLNLGNYQRSQAVTNAKASPTLLELLRM